jgi:hypothetical protein
MQQNQEEPSKPVVSSTTSNTGESTAKYIPPSMRAAAASGSSGSSSSAIPPTSVNYRRPNKSQPNINDTLEFPTLDSNVAESSGNPSDKLTNGSNNNDRYICFLISKSAIL